MPAIRDYQTYDFLGSAWSLWPPDDPRGLNIVTGTRRTTANILSVCLIRQGEDPIHPDYGMAPELFEPLTNYTPQFWLYHAEQTIMKWVPGIEELSLEMRPYDASSSGNQLFADIKFIPKIEPDINLLTFDFYAYQGAIWNQDLKTFLEGVHLNGQPFVGLKQL